MNSSHLKSLHIQGYKGLRDFQVPALGRVNLVTGRNSVGKSAVLEALFIYARKADPIAIRSVAFRKDEQPSSRINLARDNFAFDRVRFLFYGWLPGVKPDRAFSIGPLDGGEISVRAVYLVRRDDESEPSSGWIWTPNGLPDADGEVRIGIQVRKEEETAVMYPLSRLFGNAAVSESEVSSKVTMVPVQGLQEEDVYRLWSGVALTDEEALVLESLRIIIPEIDRVAFIAEESSRPTPKALIRLSGMDDRIPLDSLGEGLNRILGLVLALVNAKGGLLLIDEIGTGLHYSVQQSIWKLIFETAARLDVQVFATTHSADCVNAFALAAEESPEDGYLIRMYRSKDGDVKATLYDEQNLESVVEYGIEVR